MRQVHTHTHTDRLAHLTLFSGSLQYPLFNTSLDDESIDSDLLRLSEAVSTVHGLLVNCWVPVTIIKNHLI